MNYQELADAARAYADRNDIEVDANLDVFFIMAESRINRVLKISKQSHRMYTRSIEGQEYYALPPDFNGMRAIQFNTGQPDDDINGSKTKTLTFITPNVMADYQSGSGEPEKFYYTLVSGQIQVYPTLPHAGTIEIIHYRRLIHLDKDNITNWMSLDHPDIYLAGLICEIESFVKNYDAASLWDSKMTRMIEELRVDNEESLWAGNTLTVRLG